VESFGWKCSTYPSRIGGKASARAHTMRRQDGIPVVSLTLNVFCIPNCSHLLSLSLSFFEAERARALGSRFYDRNRDWRKLRNDDMPSRNDNHCRGISDHGIRVRFRACEVIIKGGRARARARADPRCDLRPRLIPSTKHNLGMNVVSLERAELDGAPSPSPSLSCHGRRIPT